MSTSTNLAVVKELEKIVVDGSRAPKGWRLRAIVNDDNMTYLAWNENSREAIVVDPMKDDWEALVREVQSLEGYRFLAVLDTHTHADHISCAADLADVVRAPLVMHELAPSRRIHLRVSRDTDLPSAAGKFRVLLTPGHTRDSITPIWGPFLFTGDTIIHGDTGRDDLPTGDPSAHYDSLVKIRAVATPDLLFLPGHDAVGGRVTSWRKQVELNVSLTQERETFVREAGAYVGPAPKNLRESLVENFK